MKKEEAERMLLAEIDVLNLLRTEIIKAGSQSAWARRAGIDRPTINSILNGRRSLQPKVLSALGVKRVSAYFQIEPNA